LNYSARARLAREKNNTGYSNIGNQLTLRELKARYIESVLQEEDGSIERAARRLVISRGSLYSKVKTKVVERRYGENCALSSLLQ